MEEKEIKYKDGASNFASVFYSSKESNTTLICLPAMGVRASFYNSFASQISNKGFNVITIDWRGKGKSSVRAFRKINFGYQDLINDLETLFIQIEAWFPNTQKLIIGHSLGGQIGSLFTAKFPNHVDKLILITSGSVYYKGWKGYKKRVLKIAGYAFVPITKLLGYFPSKAIGFGGRETKLFMKDLSYNILTGDYKMNGSKFNYENALKNMTKNVLSISVKNDFYISDESEEYLISKFSSKAKVKKIKVDKEDAKIEKLNHFNWTKKPAYFIKTITDWI